MSTLISIIVPLYNEEDNVIPLYDRMTAAMADLGADYEVICVDDGSCDGTKEKLKALAIKDERIKVVSFRRNFGQTAALMAGFDYSRGDIIVSIDGDLQNDPRDISILLAKLKEGYEVVSGWRKDRKDAFLRRNLPSRLANKLISALSGVYLHDYGCTLKAYDRKVVKGLKLYGEMHRFLPIYASWSGARITEVPVRHSPRVHGQSKYGLDRMFKVLLDLVVIKFLEDYHTKPIYVFGSFGIFNFLVSILSAVLAVYLKLFEDTSFIRTPLPLLVVFTFLLGVLSILLGLIAEVLVRIYFESQNKTVYQIAEKFNLKDD